MRSTVLRFTPEARKAKDAPADAQEGGTQDEGPDAPAPRDDREFGRTRNKEHDVDTTTRIGRRQFVAQGGAAVLAAVTLPGVLKRTAAAQEATPAMATPTPPEASPGPDRGETRVQFAVGDAGIIVRIADNPTSRDFVSMLPLTLEFEDFADMEKIGYLPRELTTEGSTGGAPANGDLIYFVPWGNLGFFYNAERRDPSYDDRVIPIGTIETGDERLDDLETGPVRVERIS
jgi:hypothetical protein